MQNKTSKKVYTTRVFCNINSDWLSAQPRVSPTLYIVKCLHECKLYINHIIPRHIIMLSSVYITTVKEVLDIYNSKLSLLCIML